MSMQNFFFYIFDSWYLNNSLTAYIRLRPANVYYIFKINLFPSHLWYSLIIPKLYDPSKINLMSRLFTNLYWMFQLITFNSSRLKWKKYIFFIGYPNWQFTQKTLVVKHWFLNKMKEFGEFESANWIFLEILK